MFAQWSCNIRSGQRKLTYFYNKDCQTILQLFDILNDIGKNAWKRSSESTTKYLEREEYKDRRKKTQQHPLKVILQQLQDIWEKLTQLSDNHF